MNNGLHTSSTVLSSLPVSADQAVWDCKSLLCVSVQRLNPSPICFLILPSGWWEVQPPSSANLSDLAALQESRRDVLLSISLPSFLLYSCPKAASSTMFPLCCSSLLSWQEPSRISTGCDPVQHFWSWNYKKFVTSVNQNSRQSASRCPGWQSLIHLISCQILISAHFLVTQIITQDFWLFILAFYE